MTYDVYRLVVLVPHRHEHLVALRTQLGGVAFTSLNSPLPTPPCLVPTPTRFATSHRWFSPGLEINPCAQNKRLHTLYATRTALVILELVTHNTITDAPDNPLL